MTVRRVIPNIIYGPVPSRRFGSSLGINISGPGKYCSYNCIYCFRGFNEGKAEAAALHLPDTGQVAAELDRYMDGHDLNQIQNITIAGNGEPTDNRFLPEIIDYVACIRAEKFPHLKLNILTNGMGFVPRAGTEVPGPDSEAILARIGKVDRLCLKLDSGHPKTWQKISNPGFGIRFNQWLEAVQRIPRPYIQTMLFQGRVDNSTPAEIDLLFECYRLLNPQVVYYLTLNKPPADRRLEPIPDQRMEEIKALTQAKLPKIIVW